MASTSGPPVACTSSSGRSILSLNTRSSRARISLSSTPTLAGALNLAHVNDQLEPLAAEYRAERERLNETQEKHDRSAEAAVAAGGSAAAAANLKISSDW